MYADILCSFIPKAPTNSTKNTLLSNETKKSFQKLMNFYEEDRLQEYVLQPTWQHNESEINQKICLSVKRDAKSSK